MNRRLVAVLAGVLALAGALLLAANTLLPVRSTQTGVPTRAAVTPTASEAESRDRLPAAPAQGGDSPPLRAPDPATKRALPRDTWTGVERIVAVGDVHGDYEQFFRVLRAAEVVDERGNWVAGKTHLVQTGDVLDRGPDSRKVMDLLMKLERQAEKAGGAVHALIGNHEAMVLLGQWWYVSAGELAAFGGEEAYRRAMSRDGPYGRWIRGHNAVVKINDTLFVHAGITPALAGMSLAEINRAVREQLAEDDEEGLASSGSGPLWDRSLALGQAPRVTEMLDQVLPRYGARRMVIGHTVSREGVVTAADGRLIRIDVGMSAAYGGPAACLVIEKGVPYEVRHPKGKRRLENPATRPAAAAHPSTPFRYAA